MDKKTITKDNLHLFYKNMSFNDKINNKEIINSVLNKRYSQIIQHFKDIDFLVDNGNGFDYSLMNYDSIGIENSNCVFNLEISFFDEKDKLEPLDEYIVRLKESQIYQKNIIKSNFQTNLPKQGDVLRINNINYEYYDVNDYNSNLHILRKCGSSDTLIIENEKELIEGLKAFQKFKQELEYAKLAKLAIENQNSHIIKQKI